MESNFDIRLLSKDERHRFIRETLAFNINPNQFRHIHMNVLKAEHRRFDMAGFGSEVTKFNMDILNEFAYLGIYDYTHYLYLDFYKGTPKLYLKYWNSPSSEEIELSSFGTTEIIDRILELTVLSDLSKRRIN